MVEMAGGQGDQTGGANDPGSIDDYNEPADVLAFNVGNTATDGVKALAFLDLETGQYVNFLLNPDNGGIDTFNLTPTELTGLGLVIGKTYQLDFFDTDQGGWGWGQLNQVMIAGALGALPVPELALLGLGLVSLSSVGWRRRRR